MRLSYDIVGHRYLAWGSRPRLGIVMNDSLEAFTPSGELRDFLGTTTFSTSSNERDDIANRAFVRRGKEVFPAGMAFVNLC